MLNSCSFNCSSLVRSTRFNNFSNYTTAIQHNVTIDIQDKTILLPTVVSITINTTSSNLATTITSPSWDFQQHHPASAPQFTSFSSNPPSPPYFLIPSLTLSPSRPKYGRKRQRVPINPSFTTMLTRICIPLSPLVNVLSAPLHGNSDFVLISFTETNPLIHLNLKDIFVWEIKLTIPLGDPFYLLLNPLGILSVKWAFHVQYSISSSVLTQGIPHLFVVASRSTDTTKGK